MAFSGVVRINDLDDFIAPSQECIKPVEIPKLSNNISRIKIGEDNNYTGIDNNGKIHQLKRAKITLNDCLACSGCVTTAETILIAQHSYKEFLKQLQSKVESKDAVQIFVVSISPQSCASLAVKFEMETVVFFEKLVLLFKSIGVDFVYDIAQARELSLIETNIEFCERLKSRKNLPLLTSSCPGWICYAEKTLGDAVLPYISRVKSPQQIMGSLVKNKLSSLLNILPSSIFHTCVMPCFDKKLEASRQDFFDPKTGVRDVDLVLSTLEVEELLFDLSVDLSKDSSENKNQVDPLFYDSSSSSAMTRHRGSGSGGFLDSALRHAAFQRFGVQLSSDKLCYKIVKNQDFQEINLMDPMLPEAAEPPVLRFAQAYGFRNIQIIVQQLKRGRCPYDFVEIMACPSGCLNGGGQLRLSTVKATPPDSESNSSLTNAALIGAQNPTDAKLLLAKVRAAYESLPFGDDVLHHFDTVTKIYDSLTSEQRVELLHTQYRAVPKMEVINPAAIKW